jgi:hypothetical protein
MDRLGLLRDLVKLKGLNLVELGDQRKGKKGKKAKAGRPKKASRGLQMHGGGIGNVTTANLISEANEACKQFLNAPKLLQDKDYHGAVDALFKAAAIATNVIFASRVHKVALPDQVSNDMQTVIRKSTAQIWKLGKWIAAKKVRLHEREHHGRKSASVPQAPEAPKAPTKRGRGRPRKHPVPGNGIGRGRKLMEIKY